MKKLLSLFLVLSICFTFVSCVTDADVSDVSVVSESEVSENVSLDGSDDASEDISGSVEGSEEVSENVSEAVSEETSEAVSEEVSEEVSEPDQTSTSTPLLYKVTDDKGNVTWLFGSIHIGREDFYPLPNYVLNAFNSSDALAVEFDIVAYSKDQNAVMESLQLMVYKDGTKITDHLSKEVYNEAKKILRENGLYVAPMDYYMPCFWNSLISELAYDKHGIVIENGVDEHMIKMAYDKSKEVIDIESANEQFQMEVDFSDELQETILISTILTYQTGVGIDEVDEMMNAWKSGDGETIIKSSIMATEGLTAEEAALVEEYNNAVIVERNLKMTEFAEDAMEEGKEVFICVGAAHVVGEGGMADLLAERGYTVEEIAA